MPAFIIHTPSTLPASIEFISLPFIKYLRRSLESKRQTNRRNRQIVLFTFTCIDSVNTVFLVNTIEPPATFGTFGTAMAYLMEGAKVRQYIVLLDF